MKKTTRAAVIAALYVTLCLLLAPVSYGPVQLRVSEALTLLSVLCPEAIVGVTLGCFISNMIMSTPIDMVVGTLATLVAGILSYKTRNIRFFGLAVVASIPPVVVNAVAIGAVLTVLYNGAKAPVTVWILNMISVGAGQVVSCCILGIILLTVVERNKTLLRIMIG